MEKEWICQNCRKIIPAGSPFCPHCGMSPGTREISNKPTLQIMRETDSVHLPQGTVLHDKYKVNHVLGQGGFGITYDGTDTRLQMHIAIKEYFPIQIADRSSRVSKEVTCTKSVATLYEHGMQNFLKEARNMAKFAGVPGFVAIHDYFIENNTAYIIMEFVEGQNLKNYVRRYGHLSVDSAMSIISQVMDSLEKIHAAGMIHRDVSSSNIMVLPDQRVKLLDFGAVRDVTWENRTMSTMSSVYKKGYSPIEQQTTDMSQGTYSDIYALCATFYEMITGMLPPSPFSRLSGEVNLLPPSAMGVEILPSQEEALLRGLAIYPQNRIQTVQELKNILSLKDVPGGRPNNHGFFEKKKRNKKGNKAGDWEKDPDDHRKKILRLLPVLIGAAVVLSISIGFGLANLLNKKNQESIAQTAIEKAETAQSNTGNNTDQIEDTADSTEESNTGNNTDQAEDTAGSTGEIIPDSSDLTEDTADYTEENLVDDTESEWYDIPSGALSYGGHHYYFFDDKDLASTWEEAMDLCVERGGYLCVINDSDENEALYRYVENHGYDQAFFGLRYQNGSWDYSYGDTSDFRDWGYNSKDEKQPNNADEDLYDVSLDTHMHDGHWSDNEFGKQTYRSDGHHYKNIYTFICEWDG